MPVAGTGREDADAVADAIDKGWVVALNDEELIASRRRVLAGVSWVIAAVAITGLFVKPKWDPLWAFLIVFSVATVPRWLLKQFRERHSRSRQDD